MARPRPAGLGGRGCGAGRADGLALVEHLPVPDRARLELIGELSPRSTRPDCSCHGGHRIRRSECVHETGSSPNITLVRTSAANASPNSAAYKGRRAVAVSPRECCDGHHHGGGMHFGEKGVGAVEQGSALRRHQEAEVRQRAYAPSAEPLGSQKTPRAPAATVWRDRSSARFSARRFTPRCLRVTCIYSGPYYVIW